jgi:hypothetical protein
MSKTKAQIEAEERAAAAAKAAKKPTSITSPTQTLFGNNLVTPKVPTSISKTQSFKVPENAPAPSFDRGTYGTETPNAKTSSSAGTIATPPPPATAPEQIPTVDAVPPILPPPPDSPIFSGVKAAPIDTVVFADESYASEFISDLLFEDIGGIELLSIARSDTVNGQQVLYQPIKNLGILRDTFNINSLLRLQETSDRFFANFVIRLNEKIPNVGSGENGANYYLDLVTGDGVIELINMKPDEQVELQIANAGTIEDVGI